jgi:abortive infection bacteriophage resistance protein
MSKKRYIQIQHRLNDLKERGVSLDLSDAAKWDNFIRSTNFTRICGYLRFLKDSDKNPITMEDIKKEYYFDSNLSHLISKMILYIEAYLRTQIVDSLCLSVAMFGNEAKTPHLDSSLFYDPSDKDFWWSKVKEDLAQRRATKDDYLSYCLDEYGDIEKIPIWAIVELISLDKLLILLNKTKGKTNVYTKLAPILGVDASLVYTWLLCFKDLRNAIFHNAMLRNINIKFPRGKTFPSDVKNNDQWDDYLRPILMVIKNENIFPKEVRIIEDEIRELMQS